MNKILITGASGFWGYNMIKYIIEKEKKFDITCLYNNNPEVLKEFDNYASIKKIQCKLEIENEVQKLDRDYDIIIHLASIIKHTNDNAQENIYINTKSTQNIFELGREIGKIKKVKIICASTIGTVACFDNQNDYANEDSDFSQKSMMFPYYYSKILIEKMKNMYNDDNVNIVFIRPPVIYGKNDIKGRATKRIKNFLNKKIILYTKGNIPFCDIEDLTKITYQIMKENNPQPVYNIDGIQMPLKHFFETLEELSGEKKIKIYIPYYFGIIFIYTFRNFFKLPDIVELYMGNHYWNSKSKFFKNYKWCNYKDTLTKTINYIREKDKGGIEESTKYTFYNYLYISAFFVFISKIFY